MPKGFSRQTAFIISVFLLLFFSLVFTPGESPRCSASGKEPPKEDQASKKKSGQKERQRKKAAQTVVIYNKMVKGSKEVAEYYARKRGIRPENILGLSVSSKDEISYSTYKSRIARPIRKFLRKRRKVCFLVLSTGFPFRIRETDTGEVVDEVIYKRPSPDGPKDGEEEGRLQLDVSDYVGHRVQLEAEVVTNSNRYDDGLVQLDDIKALSPFKNGTFTSANITLGENVKVFIPQWNEVRNGGSVVLKIRTDPSKDWNEVQPVDNGELLYFEDGIKQFQYRFEIEKDTQYKPGDTLRMIVPFLKAYDVTGEAIENFSEKTLRFVPGAEETLKHIESKGTPTSIISTSYKPVSYTHLTLPTKA